MNTKSISDAIAVLSEVINEAIEPANIPKSNTTAEMFLEEKRSEDPRCGTIRFLLSRTIELEQSRGGHIVTENIILKVQQGTSPSANSVRPDDITFFLPSPTMVEAALNAGTSPIKALMQNDTALLNNLAEKFKPFLLSPEGKGATSIDVLKALTGTLLDDIEHVFTPEEWNSRLTIERKTMIGGDDGGLTLTVFADQRIAKTNAGYVFEKKYTMEAEQLRGFHRLDEFVLEEQPFDMSLSNNMSPAYAAVHTTHKILAKLLTYGSFSGLIEKASMATTPYPAPVIPNPAQTQGGGIPPKPKKPRGL